MATIVCPSCQRTGNIPEKHLGKQIRCQGCSKMFVAADTNDWAVDGLPMPDLPPIPSQPPDKHVATQMEFEQKQEFAALLRGLRSEPVTIKRGTATRLAWLLCFFWNAGCFGVFVFTNGSNKNAIQESAIAGTACACMIAGYIGTRAITEACD